MEKIDDHVLDEFANLFRGNQRSYGRWLEERGSNGVRGKNITEKGSYRHDNFREHLEGAGTGIGVVPILDDATCWWGCIDIDNHGSKSDIDFGVLLERIDELKLPLVVCRSKGGGAHCYLFGVEPLRAGSVAKLMAKWAYDINAYSMATNGQVDIFPKQDRLAIGTDGERALGNYVNLPYYNSSDTIRYGVGQGIGRLSLKAFLAASSISKVTQNQVNQMLNAGHSEAPPCIYSILNEGAPGLGNRNTTMYSVVVYLKKARPDTYRDDAIDLNHKIFDVPLDQAELKKVVNSASKRDYRYKCKEDPLKSLCDSKTCLKRRFGISRSELDAMNAENDMPEFTNLVKYIGDSNRYTFDINGVTIKPIDNETLMRFIRIRDKVYHDLSILLPVISQKTWETTLMEMTANQRVVETPEDASPAGIIKSRLEEFIARADLTSDGKNPTYEDLESGLPVVREDYAATEYEAARRVVLFRGMDFVEYLRKTRSEELKSNNLWMALKDKCGATHSRVRVNGKPKNVWCVPLTDVSEFKAPDFTPEF